MRPKTRFKVTHNLKKRWCITASFSLSLPSHLLLTPNLCILCQDACLNPTNQVFGLWWQAAQLCICIAKLLWSQHLILSKIPKRKKSTPCLCDSFFHQNCFFLLLRSMRTACSHSSFWPVFHQRFGPFHRFPSKVPTYVRGSLACCSLIRLEEGGLKTNQPKKINPKSLLSQLQPLHPLPRHSLEPTTKCSGCDSIQHSSAVLLSMWEDG